MGKHRKRRGRRQAPVAQAAKPAYRLTKFHKNNKNIRGLRYVICKPIRVGRYTHCVCYGRSLPDSKPSGSICKAPFGG